MTLLLGKRKRRKELSDPDSPEGLELGNDHPDDVQARFREHFEAQFAPLDAPSPPGKQLEPVDSECSDDESESDWEGISDDEAMPANIVEYQSVELRKNEMPRVEFKSFMTSKPPSSSTKLTTTNRKPKETTNSDEAAAEEANLKNDVALQRLLKESHLLDPGSTLSLSVQNRHKALDLRLQEVGSKTSMNAQRKMPLAQRKGIAQTALRKEKRRREEAKENGIILETPRKREVRNDGKRQRSIGNPTVGRFKGGMLKLSQKDVAEIEGPRKARNRFMGGVRR